MKMTREQVADLLLRIKDDCSNVEDYDGNGKFYEARRHTLETLLYHISKGAFFRIKDNSVKKVTPALRGKWVINKFHKDEFPLSGMNLERQILRINSNWYNLEEFNQTWQLMDD